MSGQAVAKASQTFAELAREINVRLQKADDHRLSASLKLAEAKNACAEAGISFKSWVLDNIVGVGYPEATKLAKIGAAKDPAKAIEDHRTLNKARVTAHRAERTVAYVSNSPVPIRPARGKDAICHRVREAIAALSGLPPPAEVLGYLSGSDDAVIIDEHIRSAERWLSEFTGLWPTEEAS